jgi:CRP-like cAMP-binding protein/membrane protein YdbS with pleckstrin-like domain
VLQAGTAGTGQVAVAGVTLERFQKIPLAARLTAEQVQALLPHVEVVSLPKGDILFRQGDPAVYVYYVEQGLVAEVERVSAPPPPAVGQAATDKAPATEEVVLRNAGPGEYLGRYALVTGQPFRVSAVARADSILLAIPLRYIQPFLFVHEDWRSWFLRTDIATRLRAVPLFMGLDDWDIYRLADVTEVTEHAAGAAIFEIGDEARCLYVVDQGQVIEPLPPPDASPEDWPRYFGPGNFFGHTSLRRSQQRQTTAIARLPTRLFCISGQTLENLLADRIDDVIQDQARVDLPAILWEIPHFSKLTKEHLHLLSGYVCLVYHRPGDIVARQGQPAGSLMVLVEGEAVVRLQFGKGQPRTVTHFQAHPRGSRPGASGENYFGAHALFEQEMRGATVEVIRPSVWLVLYRDDFWHFLRESYLSPNDLARGSASDLSLPFKVRRHWLVPAAQVLPLTLLVYLVLELIARGVLGGALGAVGAVLLIGIASAMLYFVVDWLDDSLEVTSRAVIHTERKLIFKLERVEIPLQQVQDVKTSTNTLGQWLDVGNLTIESAARTGPMVFAMTPSPALVRDRILTAAASQDAQVGAPAPSPEGDLPLPYKVRRHWVWPLFQILPLAGILLVIVMLMGAGILGGPLLPVGVFLLVLFGFVALYRFADWLNDTYEVTTRAVIHTERRLFLSQERYEIPLQQIQNVTIRVGIIGRYLGYGNLAIDTAAAKGQIAFTTIPRPAYVQVLVQKASAQARSGLTVQRQESIRQQIEDQLYPERLKPAVPGSALIPPQIPPAGRRRGPVRLGALQDWLPRFEIREDGKVTWRKHWINLLQRTGPQFLLLLLSIYVVLALTLAAVTASLGLSVILLPPVGWFVFQAWMLLPVLFLSALAALWFIYQYVDWRNDIYIVTDDEVIDVERQLAVFPFFFFFTENRRQASLSNVQYVDLKIPHPLAMILNYGNVIVRTAGAEGTLDFLWVSNPRGVHAEILRRLAAFEEREREREFQERWGDMPRWFETYRDVLDQTGSRDG